MAKDVEIKFEREGRDGLVAVGTYLVDAAGRLGIRFDGTCDQQSAEHFCEVRVTNGSDLLTKKTAAEIDHFSAEKAGSWRLACQTRLEKAGEVTVMTESKTTQASTEETAEDTAGRFRQQFAEMPLERKMAELVQLEAMALGETFSFVINSPFTLFDKVLGVMASFGLGKERSDSEAKRPQEHRNGGPGSSGSEKGPGKTA
jgi:ferredoxin